MNKFLTKTYKVFQLVNGIPMLTNTTKNISYHSIGEAKYRLALECEKSQETNTKAGNFVILPVYDFMISYGARTQQDYLESKAKAEQKYPPLP